MQHNLSGVLNSVRKNNSERSFKTEFSSKLYMTETIFLKKAVTCKALESV